MKFFEKISPYVPILSLLVLVLFVGIALGRYEVPVYAVEAPETTEEVKNNEEGTDGEEETKEEEAEAEGSFDLEDGIYEGAGTGFRGKIKVSVEIKDKKIIAINILSSSDDEAFFSRAKGVIDKIIGGQSVDVDVVSGATYSSNGIINAVKNALKMETDSSQTTAAVSTASASGQGTVTISTVQDAAAYRDGVYYGSGTGFAGTITVKVTISGGKIAAIEITGTSDGTGYIQSASGVISGIISSQSTNVDTVSGATYSSVGIIQAVRNALSQAAVSTSETGGGDTDSGSTTAEASSEEDLTGRFPYLEGIYYGTGEGYLGDITVAVVIQDETMKAILVVEAEDDEAFLNRAKAVAANVVEQQSTEVDIVSGATYSSNGILDAIKDALENAKKATEEAAGNGEDNSSDNDTSDGDNETDDSNTSGGGDGSGEDNGSEEGDGSGEADNSDSIYRDGDYAVSVTCEPDEDEDFEAYTLSMTVTIKNDKITAVKDISGDGDSGNDRYIKWAAEGRGSYTGVVAQITGAGLPDNIDAVSRATCSSKAIIEACRQALNKAKR